LKVTSVEYEIVDRVLVLKGNFEALSTGVDGGRKATKSILNIQVPRDFSHDDPTSYIKEIAASLKLDGGCIALLTALK
jgi:adenosylcobinamide hydrolase